MRYLSDITHVFMKYLFATGALLITASPAIADDYLYLRCKTTQDLLFIDSTTSKPLENRSITGDNFYKIDFKKKTILDARSTGPLSIMIQGKTLTFRNNSNGIKSKHDTSGRINLSAPYYMSASGVVIDKSENFTVTISEEGPCKKIDASEFEKYLEQHESFRR